VDQLYFLLASVLFLALDGHHFLLLSLAESFEAVPLGATPHVSGDVALRVAEMTGSALVVGVRVALPILVVSLLLDVTLAVLARAVPQIQVFFLGLPVKFGLGLAILLLTVPGTVVLLRELLGTVPRQIALLVEAL
jgi:flagellar biosynthetic protein FliR